MRATDQKNPEYFASVLLVIFVILISPVALSAGAVAVTDSKLNDTQSSPTADFEVTPSNPGPDEEITLDASVSEAPAGEITDYSWTIDAYDWSGSEHPSGDTVTGSFDSNGDYEVELEVTDNEGATDTITKTVSVYEEAPTADFEITPAEPGPDEEITLDASGSEAPAGEITDYSWTINAYDWSGSEHPSGDTVTGSFDSNGDYEVELEVTDNGEATDTITKTVSVDATAPTADFEITPSEPGPDEEITFDASGSEAPAGEITDYSWTIDAYDWSGSEHPSGDTVTGSFDSNGDYEVELEVTDNGEATDTITKTVSVDATAPTADFEITPSEPGPDEEITFDASGSEAPAGEITDYSWTINAYDWSGSEHPSGDTVTGSFNDVGEFEVELEITDNGEQTATTTKTVTVGGDGPTADFDVSTPETSPNQAVEFDASTSEIPTGDSATYEWEYETGGYSNGTSSGQSFSHAFSDYGEFGVTLTVTDEYDRSSSLSKSVKVSGKGPTAGFTYSPSDPELNERILLDASASTEPDLAIESYRWFINGEPQGSESELDVVFNDADVYVVELEVENTGGKVDRVREKLRVGSEAEIIDNPDFSLVRDSPESKSIVVNPGETISLVSEVESEEVPEATKFVYVDGEFVNKSDVNSRTLRTTYQFQEIGEHTIGVEVEGDAGKSDVVQWDVTAHGFNSLPSVTDQSSAKTVDLDGDTEILTFSVKNPEVNDRAINTEMVVELPDGISISAASGFSEGDAAVQTSSVTIAPGNQESVRLDINVEDESLDGQQLTIPYQVRYQPVGDNNITYTPAEQELELTVGDTQSSENEEDSQGNENTSGNSTDNEAPGFGIISVVVSILILGVGSKRFLSRS